MTDLYQWVAAVRTSALPSYARHILLNLATYMDKAGGSCFPSTRRQALDTGLQRATVEKYLKIALQEGFLSAHKRDRAGQGWKGNSYQAILPAAPAEGGLPHEPPLIGKQPERLQQGGLPHEPNVAHPIGLNYPLNYPRERPALLVNESPMSPAPAALTELYWQGDIIRLNKRDYLAWLEIADGNDDALHAFLREEDTWRAQNRPGQEWFMGVKTKLGKKFTKVNGPSIR